MFKVKYFLENYFTLILPTMIMILYLSMMVGFFIFFFSPAVQALQKNNNITYPATKFAVITDPHVFEVEGNIDNPVYLKYGVDDIKLLKLSSEILEEAVNKIIQKDNLDFVLVPGDLTDSGDVKSHKVVAEILEKLKENDLKVYVIPGNHDGFNTRDFKNTTIPREIVTPEDFINIYYNCGYSEAIYQDENSLSYVVEPVKGLWLLMIDSCIYNKPNSYHICNGRVREATKNWIDYILNKADEQNKAVIGSLHHSLLEHYKGHNRFFSEYIVDDFEELSAQFASKNMRIVFTGHHHAQDIVKKEYEDNTFIYDIETSSLIGYPNAYRIVEINQNNEMSIISKYIKEIPSFKENFTNHTKNYVQSRVKKVAEEKLDKYHINPNDKDKISNQAALAMMTHYQGNEKPLETLDIEGLNIWSQFIYSFYKNLLSSLYNDPAPDDLNIKIDLNNGEWINLDD